MTGIGGYPPGYYENWLKQQQPILNEPEPLGWPQMHWIGYSNRLQKIAKIIEDIDQRALTNKDDNLRFGRDFTEEPHKLIQAEELVKIYRLAKGIEIE